MARAGDEDAEDAMVDLILAETEAADTNGEGEDLPEEVWAEIEAGNNPVRVLRTHRGFSRAALSKACGLTPEQIEAIEAGPRLCALARLKAIARVLGVPVDVLAD
ncbi:helix-turn-helix transcriptional regulator [Kaustia mangrovi]|uniref:Helix-turn-helix transcriptional regulator n=1 Tax=Kaustia mangrovi TaxID=2593653 RepID=A0A7S8C7Z3_9HYPH|nr:helix-turn-helix transcriptional regulator [Kaustia mangrovi]QPC45062.1 helix-turn-helix transcriptional regulator [Kaustia mangrovi]